MINNQLTSSHIQMNAILNKPN